MNYFLTGVTGFIGSEFLETLLRREGTIYALVRPQSVNKIDDLSHQLRVPEGKLVAVPGDLSLPGLGLTDQDVAALKGNIDAFYHLGAIYDLAADEASQQETNVNGTREAVGLAQAIGAGCFHHVSSIAAAGFYSGTFTEDMFDEAVDVDKNAYFQTKHVSEGVVRDECKIPWRIYRPGIVVGNSKTGRISKIDGPYYFFHILDKIAEVLPRWAPLPKYVGNDFNIVPVDYIAATLDHIGHQDGLDGKCFHLTDPNPQSMGAVLNEFLKAAKGPTMTLDVPLERLKDFMPEGVKAFNQDTEVVQRLKEQFYENVDLPRQLVITEDLDTHYDCSNTLAALAGTSIEVPRLKDYAATLWSYWDLHLHPKHSKPRYLEDAVAGKHVLITGGSEGIGKQASENFARAGARVIVVARSQDKLDAAVNEIKAAGGDAHSYSCDLTNLDACDELIDKVLAEHGHIDILLNNAGRSIRRSLKLTYDRFHDFERVMQLNYFTAVRLIMKVLPSMVDRGQGHVINISSIAAMGQGSARFSSYVASKSALDAFSKSAAIEYMGDNIAFTNIHMPLVRTAMIEATTSYKNVDVLTPEQAGELITDAAMNRPVEVNTSTGELMRLLNMFAPDLYLLLMGTVYQMTEDSAAARGTTRRTVAEKAMDALKELELDAKTLESVSNILKGYHS
jgi:NAD(P)-dependent dehydrogenase (short-subunit alcohol dehydrogenase family)